MQQGEINIDLSNVDNCEEKEINFILRTQQETQKDFLSNVIPLWKSIQQKLAIIIPTSDDDNEWFDEYSINIYNGNANLSSQKTPETERDSDSRQIELIKNANDLCRYFEHCKMCDEKKNIPTRVPLVIKVELFLLCKDI